MRWKGGDGDDENRHEPHEASPDGAGVPRRYVQRPPCARTHTSTQRNKCSLAGNIQLLLTENTVLMIIASNVTH